MTRNCPSSSFRWSTVGLAVVERGALTSVWVVDSRNVARMRLVKVGRQAGDRLEILAGLSAGEKVVTAGVEKVVDGARIE